MLETAKNIQKTIGCSPHCLMYCGGTKHSDSIPLNKKILDETDENDTISSHCVKKSMQTQLPPLSYVYWLNDLRSVTPHITLDLKATDHLS